MRSLVEIIAREGSVGSKMKTPEDEPYAHESLELAHAEV